MTLQLLISYLFYATGFVAVSCFLLFSIMYWRREHNESRRMKKTHENIGDVTDLFQTMCGIVEQQKQLAREFNEDLDKKMQVVKQVLGQSLNRNEELYEHQRLLTRELETVSLEIKSIQRQIEELDDMMQAGRSFERRKRLDMPKLHDAERLPEIPANPDKARSAFRALLESKEREDKIAPFPPPEKESEEIGASTLRRQIGELSAIGMNISEIAEKLNIGKGEVRLLLSLKDQQ